MARKNEYLTKIDQNIGSKIYALRISRGYSRKELSALIKVSNQQLHKYEVGINRICSGRLLMVARELNEPISYFYEDIDNDNAPPEKNQHQRLCLEVSKNFMKIKNGKHRKAINALIKSMINEEEI